MIVLEPKKINERLIKRQQQNKRLLMEKEVLNIQFFEINDSWDFDLDPKYIKCKKIKGNVRLNLNHIPNWLSNIEIDGIFNCYNSNLTTLKNCPKKINGEFWVGTNKLTSLEDGPTYVGGRYYCDNNSVKFTEKYVRSICNVKNIIII